MSEIQSISQSNYILHNIDAKKLYVQEPLFTANSGDAVYVGWRPDETVLWTNPNPSMISDGVSLTGTCSENYSAFEKIRFVCKGSCDTNENWVCPIQFQEFSYNTASASNQAGIYLPYRIGGTIYKDTCMITMNGNMFTANNGSRIQGLTSFSENKTRGPYILQIVGVNRKENA